MSAIETFPPPVSLPSPAAGAGRRSGPGSQAAGWPGEWPVLPGYAAWPSAAMAVSRSVSPDRDFSCSETTLNAVCRDSSPSCARILRRVQPEVTSALCQLVEGGVIQLTLRHRRKDRCRLANRPAGTFHPAVADFNTVKHARARGQGLRGFLPRPLYRQLPLLHFHHRDAFPAFQACVRYLPKHRQTFPLCHRQCICRNSVHWLSTAETFRSRRPLPGLSGSAYCCSRSPGQ